LEEQKTFKNRCDLRQLLCLSANISGTDKDSDKNLNSVHENDLLALKKKLAKVGGPLQTSYKRSCWPTLSRQCAFGICQCIWVWATWLWYRKILPPPPLIFLYRT